MPLSKLLHRKPYQYGLALSGGGIKGLCHAGVLKGLEEIGFRPNIISGVSAGAIVGALYADGYKPDEIAMLFENVSFRQMASIQSPTSGGFFKVTPFMKFLYAHLHSKRL